MEEHHFQSLLPRKIQERCGWEHIIVMQGCLNFVLLIIIVAGILSIGGPVGDTLKDVNEIMPEMNITIKDLGQLTPAIRRATQILDILCTESPLCK